MVVVACICVPVDLDHWLGVSAHARGRGHHAWHPRACGVARLGTPLSCIAFAPPPRSANTISAAPSLTWFLRLLLVLILQTIIIFVRPRRHGWGSRLSKRIVGAVFGSRRHQRNGPRQDVQQQQQQQQQEVAGDSNVQRGVRGCGAAATAAAAAMDCTPFGAAKLRPSEGSGAGPMLASHALQSDVQQQQQQQQAKDVEAGGRRDQRVVQEQVWEQEQEEGSELGDSDGEERTDRDEEGDGGGDGDSSSSSDGDGRGTCGEGGAAAGGNEGWFEGSRRRAVEGVKGVWRRFWRSIRETEDFKWVRVTALPISTCTAL